MTIQEHVAAALKADMEMLKRTLADFSDADMLVRPVPSANHTAWQLGHLIGSETGMIQSAEPGIMPDLPAGFREKFTKETAKLDDPAAFPRKAELLAIFDRQRAATIKWASNMKAEDLDKPAPERMRQWIPTMGRLLLLQSGHLAMHMGQVQVIRRALGKPILF